MILVTGSSGFIGSRVTEALRGRDLRLAVHRASGPHPAARRVDLADASSLAGLCDGVDVVFHCASYVGDDEERCEAVNARGTQALVDEASRAGVALIVYVSTAAVYGRAAFRGPSEGRARPAPASATSRSRLVAEEAVLAAGGLVLRPPFVYGAGDVWFIPSVVAVVRALGGLPGDGRALLSLVEVGDLARVAVAAADAGLRGVYHAAHPEPVRLLDLCSALVPDLLSSDLAAPEPRGTPGTGAVSALGQQRAQLIAVDRWFDSTRLWAEAGSGPGPGYARRMAALTSWYAARSSG